MATVSVIGSSDAQPSTYGHALVYTIFIAGAILTVVVSGNKLK